MSCRLSNVVLGCGDSPVMSTSMYKSPQRYTLLLGQFQMLSGRESNPQYACTVKATPSITVQGLVAESVTTDVLLQWTVDSDDDMFSEDIYRGANGIHHYDIYSVSPGSSASSPAWIGRTTTNHYLIHGMTVPATGQQRQYLVQIVTNGGKAVPLREAAAVSISPDILSP
eukprot:GFYU01067368.1.p1 GENE.GFYU01067368.1~~GFYU01067368.1.p1  ORF type:complete len:186 (+),score=50.61 GFYU01067368.1:49-558(+)